MFSSLSLTKKMVGVAIISFTSLGIIGAAQPAPPEAAPNDNTSKVLSQTTVKPKIETRAVTESETIPFQLVERNDASLAQGVRKVTVAGANGEKSITYTVTLTDGTETKREKTGESITKKPIDQVTLIGTKAVVAPAPAPAPQPIARPASNCDSNYSGACVPIASDVDCASGSGNGPAYVAGPLRVIGNDIYDLDRDGDGIGCE